MKFNLVVDCYGCIKYNICKVKREEMDGIPSDCPLEDFPETIEEYIDLKHDGKI